MRVSLVIENTILWAAYHLLMLAKAYREAEAVARRCVERHGLPGDYLDLIAALRAQGKNEEALKWVGELERKFPRLKRLYAVDRLRRLLLKV